MNSQGEDSSYITTEEKKERQLVRLEGLAGEPDEEESEDGFDIL